MLVTTEGIVLHQIQYGDKEYIVHFYTKDFGKVSYLTKGNSRRSAMRTVLMQPFSIVELVADNQSSRRLNFLKETKCAAPLVSIPHHPAKSVMAMFLCELLSRIFSEPHPDKNLYQFLRHSILTFDAMTDGSANFHLTFLIQLTRFLGFYPNLSHFHANVYFDMKNSVFTDTVPLSDFLTVEESEKFAQLMRMDYTTMRMFKLSRTQRIEILEQILRYYRLHLPEFGELKSLSVVSEVFD